MNTDENDHTNKLETLTRRTLNTDETKRNDTSARSRDTYSTNIKNKTKQKKDRQGEAAAHVRTIGHAVQSLCLLPLSLN